MRRSDAVSFDQTALVYQHSEQLYRLALLLAGDADNAAKLVERVYRQLPASAPNAEARLIQDLLRQRLPRPRSAARIDSARLGHAPLDRERAAALLGALASIPASARLVAGLHYLRGMSIEEIELLVSPPTWPTHKTFGSPAPQRGRGGWGVREPVSIGESLTRLRITVAQALDLVPPEVDDPQLVAIDQWLDARLPDEAATALRRAVFEQATVRGARDGMAAARDLLARSLPALFAAAPPPDLTARLLKLTERRQRPEAQPGRGWARAMLAVGVLALAAAIVFVPTWLGRRDTPTASRPPTAAELIDGAIRRFERAPLPAGILHEQYRIADGVAGAYLIERWYDYVTPHRLRVAVRAEANDGGTGPAVMEIGSDGRSLVQFRYSNNRGRSFDARPLDARVSEAEAQAALAVLRVEPAATPFSRGRGQRLDVVPLYLAQARAQSAVFLGQTRLLGRPAFLLAYRANQLPAASPRRTPTETTPMQVVLTIDAETYALLDVSVVAEGAAESSARHPFQAQTFEILPDVPDELWRLPADTRAEQRTGLPSARAPEIPNEQAIGLDDALRRAPRQLMAPQTLPSAAMRGLALAVEAGGAEQVALLYEGEFQSVLLAPLGERATIAQATGEEHSAGAFRYRIVESADQPARAAAVAFQPETPDEQTYVLLVDEYATAAEREAALDRIIGSLAPVTEQNLPDLRRIFYGPPTAGGE
jgi:hypothetical protein